jgi:hypothetical protein
MALMAAGIPFSEAFLHLLTLRRIKEVSGKPALESYLEAVRKIEQSLKGQSK